MLDYLRIIIAAHLPQRDEERGASAVEYGLLIAGVAALIVVIVFTLGGTVRGAFTDTNACIAGDGAAAAC